MQFNTRIAVSRAALPAEGRGGCRGPRSRPIARAGWAARLVQGAMVLGLCAAVVAAVGCGSGGRANGALDEDRRQTGRTLFGQSDGQAARGDAWSIVIIAFRGERHESAANEALRRVQTQGGFPDAYVQQRGDGVSTVAYGRYAGPNEPAAQRDLRRVREREIDGQQPFASAFLAPPIMSPERGPLGELDLRNARSIHGSQAIYTLQIGAYDPGPNASAADVRETRRLAEQAAAQLRREGELAFFFHGPNRSMVTIGAFSDQDHGGAFGESAELRRAREQFPHNLLNGQAMRVAGQQSLQPSFLVAIP